MVNFVLFELASGYALFERHESEEIGITLAEVQESIQDLALFGRSIKLKSFLPFKNAQDALQNINDVSEGICNGALKEFLSLNVTSKKATIGISEKNFAGSIKAQTGLNCVSDELTHELIRGIRVHITKLIKQLEGGNMEKAQLGLGHSYSRCKVKFNVNRSDNMITQAICTLDQLDKDINTFAMRVREWYGWHFPELVKIVSDNHQYAKLAQVIKNKSTLSEDDLPRLEAVVGDADLAQAVLDAARSSMGTDISEIDMLNIDMFAQRVEALFAYRTELQTYLHTKMNYVAPNLAALIGDTVGARLISHAGSLTNLSKYPASTVQILGAEKALFRALKTRGNTPKYGLIYHSTFIGRAGNKNKGRVSRYLANKCSIASRIDCFSDKPTTKFGEAMKVQVEDRLKFYETGVAVKKNNDVMESVMAMLSDNEEEQEVVSKAEPVAQAETEKPKKEKKKKRKSSSNEVEGKIEKKQKKHKKEV